MAAKIKPDNISFNKDYIKNVTLAEFKKNSIVKRLSLDEQKKLYNKLKKK